MFLFIHKIKNDQDGQGLLFTALVLLVIVAFVLTVLDVGTVVNRKIQAQTTADAAALTGASLQARTLNILSFMNIGIVACYGLIAAILLTWAFVCIMALIPFFSAAFANR